MVLTEAEQELISSDGSGSDSARRRSATVDSSSRTLRSPSPKPSHKPPKRPPPISIQTLTSSNPQSKFPDPEFDLYFTNKFNQLTTWQKENITEKMEELIEENKTQAALIQELREEQRKQAEQIALLVKLVTQLSSK